MGVIIVVASTHLIIGTSSTADTRLFLTISEGLLVWPINLTSSTSALNRNILLLIVASWASLKIKLYATLLHVLSHLLTSYHLPKALIQLLLEEDLGLGSADKYLPY